MDPCVVISFGKKVFRTRVIRHSLNPTWDEKLIFHVRRYESGFKIQFSVLDWDKLLSNDKIGDATLDLAELIRRAPQEDPETDLYPLSEDITHDMDDFTIPLVIPKNLGVDPKYKPELTFRFGLFFGVLPSSVDVQRTTNRAKHQPHDAIRQRFWRQHLKQYDIDESGDMNRVEIASMLDSLGSTLSPQTINSFFTRFGKDPFQGSIAIPQAVRCLESEICRPTSERKYVMSSPNEADNSSAFPRGNDMEEPLPSVKSGSPSPSRLQLDEKGGREDSSRRGSKRARERVINIKNCPQCRTPRLNSKAEVDVVAHITLCASQDWSRMDKTMVGNFVTASRAQSKSYTEIIGKSSSGDYKLGAVSTSLHFPCGFQNL